MSVTAAPPPAMPTPEPAGSDNSLGRISGAIFSPKATFESIARRPTWLVPLILLAILGFAMIFTFGQKVGFRAYILQQISQSESAQKRMEQLEPEKRDAAIDQQAGITKWILYITFSVGVFIFAVIVAALLMLGFIVIAGVRPTFAQSLGIVAYAWIPGIITALLAILILFLKDPSTVDLNNLVASNIGAFLPDSAAKWLKVFCTSFDVFAFWKMFLMALGFSAVDSKKLSVGKAFGIVFALYLVWVFVITGFTAAFS